MRKCLLLLGGMVLFFLSVTFSDVFGREARLTDIRGFSDTRQVLVYANWLRALTTVITIVIVSRPWATPAIGNASCPGSWPTSPTAADAIPES